MKLVGFQKSPTERHRLLPGYWVVDFECNINLFLQSETLGQFYPHPDLSK